MYRSGSGPSSGHRTLSFSRSINSYRDRKNRSSLSLVETAAFPGDELRDFCASDIFIWTFILRKQAARKDAKHARYYGYSELPPVKSRLREIWSFLFKNTKLCSVTHIKATLIPLFLLLKGVMRSFVTFSIRHCNGPPARAAACRKPRRSLRKPSSHDPPLGVSLW